jgi:DNA polymerase
VKACGHWLRLELATATPELVVCLGGTAAQALLGREARVGELRGRVLDDSDLGVQALVTLHPSAVLRAGERRAELRAQLAQDLALAREVVAGARTTG